MQLVKYRKISEEDINNFVDAKFYWIDENSKVEKDYRIFVDVYSDENKTKKLDVSKIIGSSMFLN